MMWNMFQINNKDTTFEQVATGGFISFKQIVLYVWWTSDDRSYSIS